MNSLKSPKNLLLVCLSLDSNFCDVRSLNNWFPSFVSQEDGKLENSIYGRKLSANLLIF